MKEEEILKGIPENKDDAPVLPVNHPYKIFSWRVMSRKKKKKKNRTRPFPQLTHMNTFSGSFNQCVYHFVFVSFVVTLISLQIIFVL